MNSDEKLEEMKIPLPRKYATDEDFYEVLRHERMLVWVVLLEGSRRFVHIDHPGLDFSDPCWRWIWAAFRSLHAAGQPVELPAVRELLIQQDHWDQVLPRLLEIDYPRNSIKYGEWRWGTVM